MKFKYSIIVLWLLTIIFLSNGVEAEDIWADTVLNQIVGELNRVEDFRGDVLVRVYLEGEEINYRTQVMKSRSQSMSRNVGETNDLIGKEVRLLNTVPWIYLPPDYGFLKDILPLEGQLDYNQPLDSLANLYDVDLLGEALFEDREVYLIQLSNYFSTQRLYVDKEWMAISKIEIFNVVNIKVAEISYEEYELNGDLWLPRSIILRDGRNNKIMEVSYRDLKINTGLTDFDFARGFEAAYQVQIDDLKEKIEEDPKNHRLYWLISELYQEEGDLEETIKNLKLAVKLNDRSQYRKRLAQTYRMQGLYREALKEVNTAIQMDYNNAGLYFIQGEINLQLRRSNEARRSFERAVDLKGDNAQYLEKLFLLYRNLGSDGRDDYMLDRARRTIDRLIDLDPKNSNYFIYSGDIYMEEGENSRALQAYNKGVNLAPNDTWGHIKLARFYEKVSRIDKAEELYRYIFHLDNSLENHKRLGQFYFEHNKYSLALEEYKAIARRSSGNTSVKMMIGEIYLVLEELDQGLAIFEEIIKDSNDGALYLKVGELVRRYNLKAAIDIYHKALREDGLLDDRDKEKVYSRLGHIYFEDINKKQMDSLGEILRLNSQSNIYRILGEYSLRDGYLDKAISYFTLALNKKVDLNNSYNLALAYLMVDEFELAQKKGQLLTELGAKEAGDNLIELIVQIERIKANYEEIYLPGRSKRIQGDRYRKSGDLNAAFIKYRESIYENYDYNLPYLYMGIISKIKGDNLGVQLAKAGLNDEELLVLERWVNSLNLNN